MRTEHVLLLRFELQFRTPITSMNIDWALINFAFRDDPTGWAELRLVSDSYVGLDQMQPVTVRVAEACD